MIEHTSKDCCVALKTTEATKKCKKAQYDCKFHPRTLHKGDLVLVYDQAYDVPGCGRQKTLWLGPYIIHKCLEKAAYLLEDSEDQILPNP